MGEEPIYPRFFWPAAGQTGTFYLGTELGLRRIERDGQRLRIGPPEPAEGDFLVLSLLQRPGELWLGTGRDGVWRIELDEASRLGRTTRFDEGQGLELGTVATGCIDEQSAAAPLVATGNGFFRWAGERFEGTTLDGLEQAREPDEHFCFWHAPDGARCALSGRRSFRQAAPAGPWREELPHRLEFSQDGQKRPVVTAEAIWRDGQELHGRPDAEDERDPKRLTQTHHEQINANQPFRGLVDVLAEIRYLHVVPQFIRDGERIPDRRRDSYGGRFLEQTQRRRSRPANRASGRSIRHYSGR